MNKLNCMVAQSGGPTAAINASLAGVVSRVMESEIFGECYGSINGVYGILDDRIISLSEKCREKEDMIETLKISPAMYLGSCRYKLPDYKVDEKPYKKIFKAFEEYQIGAFFYIGGNDSMDTVMKLSAYAENIGSDIKIVGVPKTIDNDLCNIDHTPGYGSAAKFVATTFLEIAHDTYIYKVQSVTIVEVMGRDAGWLTAASALARNEYSPAPDLIYLPERPFRKYEFIEDVGKLLETRNNIIIAVSEGIRDEEGNYITAGAPPTADTFGHSQLSGVGKSLEFVVKEAFGVKVRSVELNVLQRAASHIASKTDLDESFMLGYHGVIGAEEGKTKCMVTLQRVSNEPYTTKIEYHDISEIANLAKSVPQEWINARGNDITQELLDYMRPLIQGEPEIKYENGLPVYLPVNHLIS